MKKRASVCLPGKPFFMVEVYVGTYLPTNIFALHMERCTFIHMLQR